MLATSAVITLLGVTTASSGAPAPAGPGAVATAPAALALAPVPTDEVVVERYGLQIIAADSLGVALLITSKHPLALGAMGLGGPIVHLTHGNPGKAVVSAGLRAGLTVLGASLGAGIANCDAPNNSDNFCGVGEALLGAMVGYGAAVAIDAGVLAVKTARVPRAPSVAPTVAASREGLSLGVVGVF